MDVTTISEDMTPKEKKSLTEFRANGLPGLIKIDDTDVLQWFNLYMAGKTYTEISQITKKNKNLILYVSDRNKWHDSRLDHYDDLAANIIEKGKVAKIEGLNALLTTTSALSEYITSEMDRFLKNKDKGIVEEMDSKILSSLIKSIETIDKLTGNTSKGSGLPKININLNGQSEVSESKDAVEITSKTDSGDILSLLAKYKKAQNKD